MLNVMIKRGWGLGIMQLLHQLEHTESDLTGAAFRCALARVPLLAVMRVDSLIRMTLQ